MVLSRSVSRWLTWSPRGWTSGSRSSIAPELANLGVFELRLTGYEPVISRNFQAVAARAKSKDFYMVVNTNGSYGPRYTQMLLDNAFDEVIVSIDGYEETHDYIRIRGRKSFKKAVAVLETYRPAKIGAYCLLCAHPFWRLLIAYGKQIGGDARVCYLLRRLHSITSSGKSGTIAAASPPRWITSYGLSDWGSLVGCAVIPPPYLAGQAAAMLPMVLRSACLAGG